MNIRVLVAPSGFKGCLDPEHVASAIATGLRRASDAVEVRELALVDGGEGTAATLARVTDGELRPARVTGPLGEVLDTSFAMLGGTHHGTAVVELAAAAGLSHVPHDRRDPMRTTTRGVGALILAALDAGATRVIVGCGDSGVNDGGAGLAQALGVRLLDRSGEDIVGGGLGLAELDRIDLAGRDPRLARVPMEVACNVENVLTGPRGVARVFGPQKGASEDDVRTMEAALDRFAAVVERDCGVDVRLMPGGGASGGAGAGLHALVGGTLRSRFDLLFAFHGVDEAVAWADLIVTAEGGLDYKSVRGKIPSEMGRRGATAGKAVVVLAGTLGERSGEVLDEGVCAYFSVIGRPQSLDDAMRDVEEQLGRSAEQMMRTFLAGVALGRRQNSGSQA
ncbi:Glycerate 2-kinase [Methylobacterium hispanicum]|uniref:Glycerate 2-kinase n=1 Tax=Methylobacterium hispanicum TaxID=270350 RepID=A0AAV4ZGR2_9HYPH|nr:glycerate kinase [Methylobacterium hispanicum]GJD87279.1 Glycerate 2-kinase [Methylobacterium hispanicum]